MAGDQLDTLMMRLSDFVGTLGLSETFVSKTSPGFVYMEREICTEHYIEIRRWCSREHETTSDLLVRLAEAQRKQPKISGEILSITFAIIMHQL